MARDDAMMRLPPAAGIPGVHDTPERTLLRDQVARPGSDVARIRTTARRGRDGFVLDGSKLSRTAASSASAEWAIFARRRSNACGAMRGFFRSAAARPK